MVVMRIGGIGGSFFGVAEGGTIEEVAWEVCDELAEVFDGDRGVEVCLDSMIYLVQFRLYLLVLVRRNLGFAADSPRRLITPASVGFFSESLIGIWRGRAEDDWSRRRCFGRGLVLVLSS